MGKLISFRKKTEEQTAEGERRKIELELAEELRRLRETRLSYATTMLDDFDRQFEGLVASGSLAAEDREDFRRELEAHLALCRARVKQAPKLMFDDEMSFLSELQLG